MVFLRKYECVHGRNIIFETLKSNIEMMYTLSLYPQIPRDIFPTFCLWSMNMGSGVSGDPVTLEEEYPAWIVFYANPNNLHYY